MVIVYTHDEINGYRRRKLSCAYYELVKHSSQIISAWLIPGTD